MASSPSGLAVRARLALSSGRAGLPDKRSCWGAGGRSGLRAWCACLRTGRFSGARDWGSNAFGSSLLLADNYNHTTNDPTTEHTEDTQRLLQRFGTSSIFAILSGYRQQRREAAGPRSAPLGSRLRSRLPAWGPGRPGLPRRCQGGLACLASDLVQGGGTVGPGIWWRLCSDRETFRAPAKS